MLFESQHKLNTNENTQIKVMSVTCLRPLRYDY